MAEAVSVHALRKAIREDIGGGVVLRSFTFGGRRLLAGERLKEDQVRAIRNLDVLLNQKRIHVFSRDATPAEGECFLVRRGDMKYDVVKGARMNAEPLDKDEAQLLAGTKAH